MAVVVDTTVWSLAYRRRQGDLNTKEASAVHELRDLIRGQQAVLLDAVRQEVLSGLRSESQFEELKVLLRRFHGPEVQLADYESAASFSNRCRAAGVASTGPDMLICAFASRNHHSVFTLDQNFVRYAAILPFQLHNVPGQP